MFVGDRISNMKSIMVDYSSHDSPYRPNVNLWNGKGQLGNKDKSTLLI